MIGVRNHSYVTMRLIRWGVFYAWLEGDAGGPDPRPPRLASWYGPLIFDRMRQQQAGQVSPGEPACPVDILEARETDRGLGILAARYPGMRPGLLDVVREVYARGGTVEQKLGALACSRDTYYTRLELIHTGLLGVLNDVAAGLVDSGVQGPGQALGLGY